MVVRRDVLSRFLLLYCALYGGFGIASPFLPSFLAARGLQPEELGILLGAGTVVRLISAPLAGRLADVFHAFRAELALFAVVAAIASLLYLPAHAFWTVVLVSLFHAAMLAPLVPLTDALALSAARPYEHRSAGAFEYGWVRGAGSAAFVAGALLSGQAVGLYGLGSILWLSAVCLLATALSAPLVPELVTRTSVRTNKQKVLGQDWLRLLHQPAFVRVTLVAALVLGSHAMHDSFAMLRWRDAGIPPATTSVLWSESVAAEVLVFFCIGPYFLRLLGRTGALALAAAAGVMRWAVMAQTTELSALALIQPLHGFTFALLHLACMRIIADTVPSDLSGTAQALYGSAGIGGATALSTVLSGWLFAHFGPAGFWAMALLCLAAFPAIWSLQRSLSGAQTTSFGAQ
jgi:MFS transporter, PPP family, 3-phenylpropionic acid transporter